MSDTDEQEVWKDRDWLYEQYVELGRPTNDIAKDFDVTAGSISYWLNKHDIETRSISEAEANGDVAKLHDEEWARREYLEKTRSTVDIGEELDVAPNTVRRWLEKHGIETRDTPKQRSNADFDVLDDKEKLRELYHGEGLTIQEIADRTEAHLVTVLRKMKDFGIERRDAGPEKKYDTEKANDEEYLRTQYVEEGRTIEEIADECNSSNWLIKIRLEEYNIDIRSIGIEKGRPMPAVSKANAEGDIEQLEDQEWLRNQYHVEEKSTTEIAEELSLSPTTVYQYLVDYGIERRNRKEALPRGEDHRNFKRDKTDHYGPNWDEQKLKRRILDQCRCQVCGRSDNQHVEMNGRVNTVHHIQPRSDFIREDGTLDYESANRIENLITVCDEHHNGLEGIPIDNRL